MKYSLRKNEVMIIKKLIHDRVCSLTAQGEGSKGIQKLLLLQKRMFRQEEYERRKNDERKKKRDGA